jgi:selenium metabolism protein YedF
MKVVDNRGLVCPQPVINTKKAMDAMESGTVLSIAGDEIARDNILKYVDSQGFKADVTEKSGVFNILITKVAGEDDIPVPVELPQRADDGDSHGPLVVFVTTDELGKGEPELGKLLMKNFFVSLSEAKVIPNKILFINRGAFLTAEGSSVLPSLVTLAGRGSTVETCGVCLDYYHLKEKLATGSITNMYSIVDALTTAGKVITLA